jgi:hypothetical protein
VSRIVTAIDGKALVRALIALFPLSVLALVSGKTEWTDMAFRVNRDRFSSLSFHRRENFLRAA